jgi:hypothetical protein
MRRILEALRQILRRERIRVQVMLADLATLPRLCTYVASSVSLTLLFEVLPFTDEPVRGLRYTESDRRS